MSCVEILRAQGVSKWFGPNRVLDDVTFTVASRQVHALVGENGAGKSTLMNILSGNLRPDEGELRLFGELLTLHGPRDAMRHGIAIVHQELSLFPDRSVAHNIFAGREPAGRLGFVRRSTLRDDARRVLARLGADLDPGARVGDLGVAARQLVEIAKALSQDPRVLIFDEPTSALTGHEVERLLAIVDELRMRGAAIVWISHDVSEVLRIADKISVLRDGRLVACLRREEATPDRVIALMVGREREATAALAKRLAHHPLLDVEGLSRAGAFADVSFTLGAGEILGFAGLLGSGRTAVARAIFGADRTDAGRVLLNGAPFRAATPREAIAAGLAYVPEDRKTLGLFLRLSAERNVAAAALGRFTNRMRVLEPERLRRTATQLLTHLDVRPPDPDRQVGTLSGGNQQKVLLARWLAARPRVLIADEPTRGVDVGAKARIHRHLQELAEAGLGIILISSDLPELLALAHRIAVFRRGRIVAMLDTPTSQEAVMRYAVT
jgi:ABC-type sugar transport system ATPase subunit